ncbi:MAG: protease modulator HflC [Chloroflexi bacterium]|nr:protease modulator HflC [Chloroflexota bacterium]
MRLLTAIVVLAIIGLIIGTQGLYTVSETEQVVITQLGEYKETVKSAGLYFRIPLYQQVNRFEKRVLSLDVPPSEYLTQDKKRLVVDQITRWSISDPLEFFKTVRDEPGARARLDDIISSELRRELAQDNYSDIFSVKREPIMERVAAAARERAAQYGINVVDSRIKRVDLPQEVVQSVYQRMQQERQRIAKGSRAEGEEAALQIRAQADKEKTIILAQAYEQSQKLRGEGDAEATRLYAEAYNKDAEFYAFVRSLQAYEATLGTKSTLVLDANSPLLRYLANPSGLSSPSRKP